MGFRINTNISAMTANMHLNSKSMAANKSLASLSSGLAINSASDNGSGLAISNQLSVHVTGLGQSIMNANDSIGMIQIADGAMQEYGDILDNVRNLTLKASSGIMNASNRASIQQEIDKLMSSANNIISSTSYNGINIFNDPDTGITDSTFNSKVGTIDVMSQDSIDTALDNIDAARANVSSFRSELGSSQNQLSSMIRNTSVTQINMASAQSQIKDLDFAAESANFSKANISSQLGSFVQAQANASASNITALFN